MKDTMAGIARFLHRRWLPILVATALGAAVAAAASYEAPETYTASVALQPDMWALQRYPEMGSVDGLVRELRSEAFAQQVALVTDDASRGGTLSAHVRAGEVIVTFTAADRDLAEEIGLVLGDQALERFAIANQGTIGRQRALVESDDIALQNMRALYPRITDPYERVAAQQMIWSVSAAKIGHDSDLAELRATYAFVAGPNVEQTQAQASLKSALGGALLGFMAGVVIGYIADRTSRVRATG